jgi:hypothetical protein
MSPRAALLIALLALSGCAIQSAAPSSMAQSSSISPGAARREQATGSLGVAPTSPAQPVGAAYPSASISSTSGGSMTRGADLEFPNEDDGARDTRIAQWETEIERQRGQLAASLAQCRDICVAAGNVCTAASEICRLTGDLTRANARDARCTRARSACVDAGRRRDGACPVCPAR